MAPCLPMRKQALTLHPPLETQAGPSSYLVRFPSCFPKIKGLLPAPCLSGNYLVSVLLPSNYFPHLQSNCLLLLISTVILYRAQGTCLLTLIFLLLMLKSPLELAFTDTSRAGVSSHQLTLPQGRVFAVTAESAAGSESSVRPSLMSDGVFIMNVMQVKSCGRSVSLYLVLAEKTDLHIGREGM